MLIKALFIASAATALMGGAALAQDASSTLNPSNRSVNNPPAAEADPLKAIRPDPNPVTGSPNGALRSAPYVDSSSTVSTSSTWSAPAATGTASDVSVTLPAAPAATFTVETVTNGPVPDTPENRRLYGAPESRAGKMTAARGN